MPTSGVIKWLAGQTQAFELPRTCQMSTTSRARALSWRRRWKMRSTPAIEYSAAVRQQQGTQASPAGPAQKAEVTAFCRLKPQHLRIAACKSNVLGKCLRMHCISNNRVLTSTEGGKEGTPAVSCSRGAASQDRWTARERLNSSDQWR